ncbi:MAG: hypothetical protein C6W57_01390 [Caldibacillus debilis]|nr:MAG: hypothetical protein C6W57_01390 [Caldibacillus debilis]
MAVRSFYIGWIRFAACPSLTGMEGGLFGAAQECPTCGFCPAGMSNIPVSAVEGWSGIKGSVRHFCKKVQ